MLLWQLLKVFMSCSTARGPAGGARPGPGQILEIWQPGFVNLESTKISKINNLVGNIKKIFNETNNNLSIGILENGISVRFLGSSSQDARKCFFCIWKQIRSVCGFCEPKYQGVWPLQDSMNY